MSRKRLTLLSVGTAIVLAAALAVGVWLTYFTGRGSGIHLPPPPPPGFSPDNPAPSAGGLEFTPVAVDAGNVQRILTAVKRPEAYSQTIRSVTYWEGGEMSATHRWAQRGAMKRIESFEEGRTQNRIIAASGNVYEWWGSVMPYFTLSPEETDAESLSRLPTWEDAASLPPQDVLDAESYYEDGEQRLRVLTRRPVYKVEYILSLDTGLLIAAEYTGADGETAFSFTAEAPVIGDPGDARFTLPDGTLAEG
ncbi:MAG: hypothetical protein LBR76_08885 [Oscillospiraceae bacterium]|jgi:hypothetical protein|nr:hypothetical protein [Oscillospiraceae bacterium]